MSLLFIDGFDDGLLLTKWDYVNQVSGTGTGRNGSGLVMAGSGTSTTNRNVKKKVLAADEHATFIAGVAWKSVSSFTNQSSGMGVLCFMSDAFATEHLKITADGALLTLRRGSTQIAQSIRTVQANTWYYVEMKATLADSGGTVEVRVNGEVWITYTGDTKNGGTKTVFDSVGLGWDSQNNTYTFDDFYLCNGAGSYNNDFLGEIAIETLFPDGNGSQSDLVGTDGNSVDNYLLVDEASANTTDYVGSSTSGQRDLYTLGALARTAGSVRGVQVVAYTSKSDSNPVSCKLPVARSGTVSAGTAQSIITAAGSWGTLVRAVDVDPVSGTPFTISNINALEAGFEVA